MAWIGIVVEAVLGVLKAIFGTSRIQENEVINAKPDKPLLSALTRDELLNDLGMHRVDPGATGEDGVRDNAPRETGTGPRK